MVRPSSKRSMRSPCSHRTPTSQPMRGRHALSISPSLVTSPSPCPISFFEKTLKPSLPPGNSPACPDAAASEDGDGLNTKAVIQSPTPRREIRRGQGQGSRTVDLFDPSGPLVSTLATERLQASSLASDLHRPVVALYNPRR